MTDIARYASPVDTESYGEYRITQTRGRPPAAVPLRGSHQCRRLDAVRRRGRSLPHLLGVVLPVGPAGHDRPRAAPGCDDVISVSYVDGKRDARGWAFRESNGPTR